MGIYKVIQIKLPKIPQNSKRQYKKKTRQIKKTHHFFAKKKKISLQQTIILLFLFVLFAKGISLWQSSSKQEVENKATQANFFLKDSLPY